jgi:hypothetical protein
MVERNTLLHNVTVPTTFAATRHYVVDQGGIVPRNAGFRFAQNLRYSRLYVDLTGIEPVISAMRMRRITNCATGPLL